MADDDPHWYKDAVVYECHVKSFFDADDDGIGDFRGLTAKLDYLVELGVTAIWLLPFYPSPLKDDGYDIGDYRSVNPAFGGMADFSAFVRAAHGAGIKVITELVINHTSDRHAWFQRARRAKAGSAARDFYVWSDTDRKYRDTRIIFCDTEASNWAWDGEAKAYFWHRFFSHQPDLNFDNPRVVDEVLRVMKFWLDKGVDGMRLDAIPYLVEREGTSNENLPETHAVVRRLRAWLDANYTGRMFLGEANQWPEDVRPYFGEGDECHMAFHFPLMPRVYMALAQEDRHPITDIMRQTPDIPESCQWAVFLRNHDELTLEMVTDRERDYLWRTYAEDPSARINLGIRRRLAPLLDNDRRKIELLNSLLMSMPGTPILYYGDEIGMGDNFFLGDRNGVRTPMQWSPDRNAGFSRADPARLFLQPIMDPVYGFGSINVEAQTRSPASLLNWMKRIITVRKAHRAFGRGTLAFLYPRNRKVLAFLREEGAESLLCVANLSRAAQPVELDLSAYKGRVPVELLGRSPFPPVGELPYFVTLPAYGFYWFLLADAAAAPRWYEPQVTPLPEFQTLVLPHGWHSLSDGTARQQLTRHVLPEFLRHQRWFAGRSGGGLACELGERAVFTGGDGASWLLAVVTVGAPAAQDAWFLPLADAWESAGEDLLGGGRLPFTCARIRRGHRIGILYDAMADDAFGRALAGAILAGGEVATMAGGRVAFEPTGAGRGVSLPPEAALSRFGREQSNTSVMVGDMVLKIFRRLATGSHPEIEIGRFLTDEAHYVNTPPLLGAVRLIAADGREMALAVLQGFVRNQGDGWTVALEYLDRVLGGVELGLSQPPDLHANALMATRTLGTRVAELHRAFCRDTGDPAFTPEAIGPQDLAVWRARIAGTAESARRALERAPPPEGARPLVERLLKAWPAIETRIAAMADIEVRAAKTRVHGDLHLGQVMVAQDDFFIVDFEGEPDRPLAERRAKDTCLRDVAGMLRSFDYAASAAVLQRPDVAPAALEALRAAAETWRAQTARAFLAGYRATIAGCAAWPEDEGAMQALLDALMLEKAFYEIGYEAARRPAWLRIPLGGALRILER